MSDKQKTVDQNTESVSVDSLDPIPFKSRLVKPMSYSMIFWSSYIAVQIITIGLYLMVPIGQLNFIQVLVACVVSGVIFAVIQALLGDAGARYGIPFVVQIRSAFGTKGAKIIGIFRSIPAIIWNGICTWYGADALNIVCMKIFGFGNPYVFFGILMVIQIVLCIRGFETIAWFDSVMSIVIFGLMAYFFVVVFSSGKVDLSVAMQVEGSWGKPFIIGCFAGVAHMAACLLNGSDLSRQIKFKNEKEVMGKNMLFTLLGAIPPWICMWMAGVIISAATQATDPIAGLAELAPNDFFAILLMLFLMLAQVTSNLSLNLLCGGYVFQDVFKWDWKRSIIATGIASVVICPWILQGSSYFLTVQNLYSMFLGPAAGIMIIDYYFVRKKKLKIKDLYTGEKYLYTKGWNIPAFIALGIGWICAIIFLDLAWIVGFGVSFAVYAFMKFVLKLGLKHDQIQAAD